MSLYEFERYVCTADTLKSTLEAFGVAIIPSVLSENECDEMLNGMWSFLEHITRSWPTPINRNNKVSYIEIHKLHLLRGAMFQQYSNGHSQYMWNLRQNPKLVQIFSQFWEVSPEELLVSFDGSNFSIPNNTLASVSKAMKRTQHQTNDEAWYHLDQSLIRPEFECAQSWVNAFDTGEGDATLGFLECSNKYFSEFANYCTAQNASDWKLLSKTELEFYRERGCVEKRIKCPRGSLVVWDSRTVHFGAPSMKIPSEQNYRLVGYVCYRPRYFITKQMLGQKLTAFKQMDTTSHHPTNFRVFRKLPPNVTLDYPITPILPPVLNDLGRKLAGFD